MTTDTTRPEVRTLLAEALRTIVESWHAAIKVRDMPAPIYRASVLTAMQVWPKGANGPIAIAAYEALVERLEHHAAVVSAAVAGLDLEAAQSVPPSKGLDLPPMCHAGPDGACDDEECLAHGQSIPPSEGLLREAVLAYLDHMDKREPYRDIAADIKQAGMGGPDFAMDRHFDGDGCFAAMERAALSEPPSKP